MGVIGAAIATAIAYAITWLIRIIKVKKYITLNLNLKKDCIAYTILVVQSVILYIFNESFEFYLVEFFMFGGITILYYKHLLKIYSKIKYSFGGNKKFETKK